MKVNLVPDQKEKVQEPLAAARGSYDAQVDAIKKFVKALRRELKEAEVKFHIYRSAKVDLYRRADALPAEATDMLEEKESDLLGVIKRIEALLQRAISELALVMEGEEASEAEAVKELESELRELEDEYNSMKEDVQEEISDTQKMLEELQSDFDEEGLSDEGPAADEVVIEDVNEVPGNEGEEGAGGEEEQAKEGPAEEGILNVLKGGSSDAKAKVANALSVYKDAAIKEVQETDGLMPSTKSSIIEAIQACGTKECVDEVLSFFNLASPAANVTSASANGGAKNMKKAEVLNENKNTVDATFLSADTGADVDSPASKDWAENNRAEADAFLNSLVDQDRGPLFDDPEVKKFFRQFAAAVAAASKDATNGPAKVATALLSHPIGAQAAEYMVRLAKNSTRILYASAIAGVMKGMTDNPLVDSIKEEVKQAAAVFYDIDLPDDLAEAIAKNASVKALESFVDAVSDTYKRFASMSKKAGTADALLDIVKQVKEYETEVFAFTDDSGVKSASLNPNVVVPSDTMDAANSDFLTKLEERLKHRN